MGRKVFSKEWLRAIGAALTLAGAAIVFVVLFLPTGASARSTHCNLEAGGSHSAASISGFSVTTDKPANAAGDGSSTNSHWVAVFMSDASSISDVWFPVNKSDGTNVGDLGGKLVPWLEGSSVYRDAGANTVWAEIPAEAVKGKLRLNHSSNPNFCYVQTQKTFNPN